MRHDIGGGGRALARRGYARSHSRASNQADIEYDASGMYDTCILQEYAAVEATVAERGQITLPKSVRDALGLSKGSILKVELDGSRIILRKSVDDAISRARGRFKLDGFATTDDALRAIRSRAPGDPLDADPTT